MIFGFEIVSNVPIILVLYVPFATFLLGIIFGSYLERKRKKDIIPDASMIGPDLLLILRLKEETPREP